MLSDRHITHLKALVGSNNVLLDADDLQHYGGDWARQYSPQPSCIVFPTSTEQVVAIVEWAKDNAIALVPSAGRTGLSGGAAATQGEVVVSISKMNAVLERDSVSGTITVEGGVITQIVQQEAEQMGLYYPVDFASSGSSMIAGNIATNAGGIKVIRYGMTRDWVLGLKVVTGTGEVLELNHGLLKNNTGYDFRHLFIGSEGTLGFITEATLKLAKPPKASSVLVLGVESMNDIMKILDRFQQQASLSAFEFFSDNAMSAVIAHRGIARPFESKTPFYVLLETEQGSESDLEHILETFEYCLGQGWVTDGVISQSQAQAQELWQLREGISEAIASHKPYKNDLSVKVSRVPDFLQQVNDVVSHEYPDFEVCWYGHIGDGNLHLNILKPESLELDAFLANCELVSRRIFEIVASFNGSVSAEHGVGLLKKKALGYSRSETEIALMKAIKAQFDPANILNPGKVF